jgi:hypothetical protein
VVLLRAGFWLILIDLVPYWEDGLVDVSLAAFYPCYHLKRKVGGTVKYKKKDPVAAESKSLQPTLR